MHEPPGAAQAAPDEPAATSPPAATTATDAPAAGAPAAVELFLTAQPDAIYAAEIDLDRLARRAPGAPRRAVPLPRFPAVVRDIALLLDDRLSAETVRGTIRAAAPDTLISLIEFDRYQGKGIPDGKVSLALRLTFQSAERTLTDAEVQDAVTSIVRALADSLGAVQR